ncbi:MAG: InlB B-repeat-containing protein, partial [Clostridia bacterium]|nr:InlB B-repeat-containing protein [Clostridia bacterium]
MYRIGKKVSIGVLCALFALVLTLVAVFALAPNTSAAHAETEYTVVWNLNVIKALPEDSNTELASIADAASSRTITMKSVNGYIYHSYNYDYDDPVYEYSELHNSSVATGFTFSISNPSETTVTYFTKIEIKGGGANINDTPTGSGWTENDSNITWNGNALTVDCNVDGYVSELSEIKYTFKVVDGFVTTLNTNGGTINSGNVIFYETGVGATLPTDVTKNGYGFKGWYDNAAFDGEPVIAIGTEATGAKEFWAKWLPTVTLNTNDGVINSGEITEYIEGVSATLPADVTKENCTFGGWYDNATFDGEPVTAIGTEATGGKTYWAKWICSVTLNTNGGTINSGDVTEYAEGVGATLPTDVTKEDAFFAGWYDNASFEGDPVTTIGTNDRGPKEYWAKYLDHIHEYSSAWSYDDSKHWHACTSTKGVCDAPIIDEEEHSFDESLDTTAYYKCKCGYENEESKNTFYNDLTTVEIDTNKGQSVYTKRNVTITVDNKGDNSGACVNATNTMVIEITGNVAIRKIRFVSGVGSWYTNFREGFTVKRGYTSTTCTVSFNTDSQEIICNYIDSKRAVVNNTKGWTAIKKVIIESEIQASSIVYNLAGGEFDGNYQDYYVHGQGFDVPTNVVKNGYVFRGWYDNEELTGETVTQIPSWTTGEKKLWAKWDATITYNQNGGEFAGTYPTTYALGVGETLPTDISKNGYAFGCWWNNADFEGAPISTIGTDATEPYILWAKWYPIGYHIIGSMTDWKVDEKYLLTKNTAVTDIDEYYIELPIVAGAEFKVVHGNAVYGGEGVKNTWYPDGTDNSYTVSESGFYRVFFRPDGNGDSDWHENVLLAKRLFAQVNGINYYTIADAYAVVTAGGTIKLVDDLDLSGATDCLDVTKNVTIDLNGFILNITTSTDPKIAVNGGAVITIDDSSDDIGGVKGACAVYSEKGSYIVLKNCRLSLDATAVRFGWRINHTATGYVVRSIEGEPDADGFVTIVRPGTDQEIADDVVELIDAIGTVEATTTSKQKINDARERYDALTTEQNGLVAEAKRTTLEEAEAKYIQLLVDTINALPAVGSIVCEDKPKVENARALYEMLTDTEKTAFSAEALAKLQAAEVDIADCEAAKAAENRIEALPSTILFEHSDDVARARVVYDALTNYQKGKVPTATYNKLPAAEAEIAEWNVAMMVTAQIEGLPAAEEITIDNKTRIESARAKYDALTGTVKDKVTAETVSKLEAAENAWAAMKAASDVADVVEAAIAAIGKLERTEACQQKIADAREQYNNLTDLQKSLVDNYSTLVYAENKYAAYVAAADAVIGKINAIGTVENTEESKEKIDDARAAFNALLTEEKEFVTNYDVLAAAESAYAAFTPIENVAEIGETKYTTVLEALTTAKKGETVKLLTDIDLSDKEKAYITLRRDITIDLNGHELNVTSASLTYIIWASDGAVITIDNSVPEQGGIKGLLGADYLSGAKIVLINCRLTVSVVEFSEYDAFLSIGDDCVMKDLNSGKMSVVGYASVVRPIGDQDLADDVIDLIKAIKEIELTEESNAPIRAAREGYDALTDGQKALVENFSVLTSAESAYAALATAKFEALPAADAITIADKSNVETARAIYDSLTDAEKAYVPAETVTKLTDAEAALAVILEDYILAGDDCIHRSVQITDVYVSSSQLTQSSYSDPDIQNGHEGIKIKFKKNGARTQSGTARVTVKIILAEAHEVEIWWKFDYEAKKHNCSLKVTHDSENWVSAPLNAEWKVDRVYLEAGTYTFQYECKVWDKNPLSSENRDRYFYVVPMFFPSFDDNCICTLCGTECLHETVSVAYDAEKNDYHFVCKDNCFKTIDLNAISFDQETSFETARAAYDALTDEQKAMFRPSDLFKLEAHEMKVAEIEAEQNAVNDEKTAFKVTELINGLPEASAVTLKDTVAVQAARAAYDALTAKQKAYVTAATLARLTDVEEKYTQIKANADAEEKDAVIALINALPVGDAITFENRSLIEQAGVAYNMLTSAQKGQITTETKNVLSAAELRGVIVSWEDFFPEDGTYILVSATDESKAIVRIDEDTIKIGTYGDMDVNDPDVATANNRDFKWKIERRGSNVFYTLLNIFHTGDNYRLLDVAAWENQLSDGSKLGLVFTEADKSEYETNVFRFSKRKGVDLEDDEYYIRAVSTDNNRYNLTITLRTGDSVNIGTYRAKNGGQVWKLVRVKGDEDFAQEVMDKIAALPTYNNVALDDESDVVAVREAYTALNEYQKTLVSNLDYLVSAEQKIVDIKAANAVDDKITAIGTVEDTAASKAKVDEVREAYKAITDAQRLLVTKLDTLVAAEKACADFVTAVIEAIPASAEITINNKTAINAARAKYEALTPEEKTHVTQATIDKLSAAEVTITVISLPAVGVLTLENKAAVVAARAEYTALTDGAKEVFGVLETLVAAETEIADIEAAKAVTDAITALPDIANITVGDSDAVMEVVTAYNALSPYQQGKVPADKVNKLFAEKMSIIILALPAYDDITLKHETAVNDAYGAYLALTDDQRQLMLPDVTTKITSEKKKIDDMNAAKAVTNLIEAIGEVEYTDGSKEKIDTARKQYNGLTDEQEAFVTADTLTILTDAEKEYADAANEAIYAKLSKDIDEITDEDKEHIAEAKATYDDLTDEEKDLIPQGTKDRLFASVTTIAVLEILDADGIDEDITDEDANKIKAAKEMYDDLTPEQQALMPKDAVNKVLASA